MSFAKLLGAGKSLIGMKDQDCPYRMRRQNLLPKFESARNPFAQPAKTESVKVQTVASTVVAAKTEPCAMETSLLFDEQLKPVAKAVVTIVPVKEAGPAPVETIAIKVAPKPASPIMELPAVKPPVRQHATRNTPVPAAAPAPAPQAAKSAGFPAWMKKLNPLAYLPAHKSDGQSGRPKSGRTPVQADFSWENVKVVRNDLNDTDLEVVSVPAAGKAASARRTPSLAKTEPTTLNRMTARFFGAGQPQS